jgi:hypothetical protein
VGDARTLAHSSDSITLVWDTEWFTGSSCIRVTPLSCTRCVVKARLLCVRPVCVKIFGHPRAAPVHQTDSLPHNGAPCAPPGGYQSRPVCMRHADRRDVSKHTAWRGAVVPMGGDDGTLGPGPRFGRAQSPSAPSRASLSRGLQDRQHAPPICDSSSARVMVQALPTCSRHPVSPAGYLHALPRMRHTRAGAQSTDPVVWVEGRGR